MANGGSIKYNIGFNVDKSGLNQLKSSLQEVRNMTMNDFLKINNGDINKANQDLQAVQRTLQTIDRAFESAFNADLGTLNIAKFNQNLQSTQGGVAKIQAELNKAGAAGQTAFRNMASQILTTNMKLKESHTLLDNMATTMANTIKWGIASSAMNSFTGTVQKAYGYVKNLDGSLNDIRIVTGKSAEEMERFAKKANKAAKNLGQTTTNYTDAALIYYQQGLSDEEAAARAEVTLKAANVTGQSGAEVSEQLTAVWNGYKVNAAEAELYIDKLAAVAATTAADLEELSTGMSKVASAANLMGVDIDQLNAQLATIVSVTRQAPESVGTALKTIYARMGDIEAGLDSETTLGDYTEKMAAMGVNVLDMNGQLRDMGEVMEEIGGKWTSMSREQQVYLSQVMAGTRQYNNLLSLFDNWDQYTKALETSSNAAGTLQDQQDIYMKSTEAHLKQLKAEWEDLYDSLLDEKAINGIADALGKVVKLMTNFVDSIGGGTGVLTLLGSTALRVFSKQIASGLATTIMNFKTAKDNAAQLKAEMALTDQLGTLKYNDEGKTAELVAMKREQLNLSKAMTIEEKELSNAYISQKNELFNEQEVLKENLRLAEERYKQTLSPQDQGSAKNLYNEKTNKVDEKVQQEMSNFFKGQIQETDTAIESLTRYKNETRNVAKACQDYLAELDALEPETEEYANKVKELSSAFDRHFVSQKQVVEEAQKALKADGQQTESKKELARALKEYNEAAKKSNENPKDVLLMTQAEEKRQRVLDATIKVQQERKKVLTQDKQAIDNSNTSLEHNRQKIEEVNQANKNLISTVQLKNTIQNIVQVTGQLGQFAMGIQNIQRLGSIWKNEDLSAGEKTLQIMMNLSMTLPMLISGFGGVSKVFTGTFNGLKQIPAMITGVKSAYSSLNTVQGASQGLLKGMNSLDQKRALLKDRELMQQQLFKKYYNEERLLLQQKGQKMTKENMERIKSIATKKAEQGVTKQTIALDKIEIGLKALKYWWIGLIIVAMGALAIGIYAAAKAQNKNKEEMEKANKALEEQKKHLSTVKEEYENIKSTLENYNNARKALDGMVEGTLEWKEAVTNLNQEVLDLIQKYPELAEEVKNVNGVLEISEEGQKILLEKGFEKVQRAQQGVAIATAEANQKTKDYKLEQASKGMKYTYTAETASSYSAQGSNNVYRSSQTSAYYNGQGNSETYEATFTGNLSEENIKKAIDALQENNAFLAKNEDTAQAIFGKSFEELSRSEQEQVKALRANSTELTKLSAEFAALDFSEEFAQNQAKVTTLEGLGFSSYNQADSATKTAIAKKYGDEIDAEAENTRKDVEKLKVEEQLKEAGITNYTSAKVDDDGYIVLKDAEGNEIEKIYQDHLVEQLAQDRAAKKVINQEMVDEAVNTISTLQDTANNLVEGSGQYMASFMDGGAGSFAGASGSKVDEIESKINDSSFIKDNYEAYGFESEDAMRAQVESAIKQYWDTYNGYALAATSRDSAAVTSEIQNALSNGGSIEDLSEEQQAHLTKLEKQYTQLGEIQNKNSYEYRKQLREIIEIEEENARKELEIQRQKDEEAAAFHREEIERLQAQRDAAIHNGNYEEANELSIQIEAEVTAFEETMDNLQDYYKEMKIQIDADLKTDVEEAFGLADEFGRLQEMVADDLTLTFEEAQDLINQGYGAILQNAQETSEQTIMLDKATMNAFIDNKQAEMEADRQTKIQQLEDQKTVLIAQKNALDAKLTALEEALVAENGAEAAAALQKAERAEGEYQVEVTKMGALLEEQSNTATKKEDIDADLYNSLGGMYDQDSINLQTAEQKATDHQKAEIEARVHNVQQLHDAYSQLALNVQAAMNGTTPHAWKPITNFKGSTSVIAPSHEEMTQQDDFTQEAPTLDELDLDKYFESEEGKKQYQDTINALINQTKQELDGIEAQIGAADAGIAALKGADISLDKAQKDAKVGGSNGSGSGKDKDKEKEKEKDIMELVEDERDIYHDVNYELEQINKKLSQQERITEKLTGKDKIKSLKEESKLLDDQIAKEQSKLALLENESKVLKDKLSKDGVEFDEDGDIANFNAALDKKLSALNQAIAAYNALDAEAQTDAEKAKVEAAQAAYDQFKEDMERYEEIVLNEIEDSRDAMREAFDKQIELQIEALELEIQLKIDTNEAERQLNDFIKTYIDGIEEDDYAGTAKFNIKQIGTYTGADGDLAIKTNAMNDALDAYRKIKAGGTDDIYGDDAERAMEAYKQYRDEAMDIYSEIKDLIDEIEKAQVDAIDNFIEEMDEHIEQYDRIGDELERNLELSKLINGENDYETQLKYYDAIKINNREQVQALKEKVDILKEQQKLVKDSGNQELIDTIAEQLIKAEEELAEKTAESLEMIAEAYDVAAKKLQDDLEKSMTNGLGLEYISEEWEMINDNADLYLDAINSAYEISKLEADIMDAIDNTDSLYAQERLNKLRDQELGKLRQKEKITKYDVERANKMLDIELKRIALEEAQSSKTQMRLRRDSQGNYTYQYVSDDSKVSEAQKALDEAQNELYNMDKEQYKTVLDDYKDALSDYMDDVADLMENYEEGTEEFYRQLQLIKDKYRPKLEGAFDMMVTAEGNLDDSAAQQLLEHFGVNLDELSEEDREYYMKNIIPQLNSEMAKSFELYGDQGFDAVFDDWTERLIKLMDDKKKEMKDAGVEGGIDPDKVTDPSIDMSETYKDMDNTMDSLVDKHKDINSSLRESAKYAKEYSDNMKDAADKFVQAVKAGNKLIAWSESGEDVSVSGADNPDKPTSNKGKDTKTDTKDDKLPSNKSNPNVETITGEVQGRWESTGQGNGKVLYEMQSSTAALNLINPIQDIGALIDKLDDSLSHRLDKLEYTTSAAFANLERLLRELSDKERDILEQQVTISADFPNVLEAKEIEEAFMNLTNLASQHAYHISR